MNNLQNNTPENWSLEIIGNIFDFKGGGTPSKSEPKYWNGNICWASVKDIKGDYLLSTEDKITQLGVDNSATNIAKPGDLILITRINPGKTIVSKITTAVNQDLKIVSPKIDIFPAYAWYLFRSIEKKCIELSSGTTVLGISLNILNEIIIPLPPLPEQHRIVAKIEELFSELDRGVQALQTAKAQLKTYRQAVLKHAFEGKLTVDWRRNNAPTAVGADRDLPGQARKENESLPEGWERLSLKDLTNEKDGLRRGPFGSAIKKEFFVSDGYKVYEQGNAINDDPFRGHYYISKDKYNELINFNVLPGDLIVSCSGSLGRISKIPINAKPGVINQALLRIRLRSNRVNDNYFIHYFRAAFFQKVIFDQSQGSAMTNLVGIKDFKEIKIYIPSLPEQSAIVAEIESRLSVCDKLETTIEQSLAQAESLRQSILKKAFEGKLVPQDPNDEPAGVLLERIRNQLPPTPSVRQSSPQALSKRGSKSGSR